MILTVPSLNKALRDEMDALKLQLPASTTGYYPVEDALLPLLVIDLGVVAEREDDDFLRWFAGRPLQRLATEQWVWQHFQQGPDMSLNATPDLYGYDELVRRSLRNYTPEQRLEGLAPEERLAGLAPDHIALALPAEVLRTLSDDYIATLPAEVQREVRARRGR